MIVKYALSETLIRIFGKKKKINTTHNSEIKKRKINWKKLYYELYKESEVKLEYQKPIEHKNRYINGIINRINYKKNTELYKKICKRTAIMDNVINADKIYNTLDEYCNERINLNNEFMFGSGAVELTSWKWVPSYLNRKKHKLKNDDMSDRIESDDEDQEGQEFKTNDTNCYGVYHDKDYLVLSYSRIWNAPDMIHKIYVEKEDASKVKKIIDNMIKHIIRSLKI